MRTPHDNNLPVRRTSVRLTIWRTVAALGVALGAIAAADAPPTAQNRPLDLPVKTLVARATAYVDQYQKDFAFLVADEMSTQHGTEGNQYRSRQTRGEMFLTYLEADRQWVAVHDIAEVDGRPVTDREDLHDLLQHSSVRSVAQRLFERNARYNIGSVGRNFNEPTLALLVLSGKFESNFSFSLGAVEHAAPDENVVTINFRERSAPTIIHGTRGDPVYSTGSMAIDAETGQVRRLRMQMRDNRVSAELLTVFAPAKGLDLWVPSTFTEQYTTNGSGRVEVMHVETVFTNYRRFGVSGRIE